MRIADFLPTDHIIPELRGARKLDAIKALAAKLSEGLEGTTGEDIANVLIERERQGSTAIEAGLAVPHGKLESISRMAVCLGRSRKGIDFGSADGRPTHLFFAVVAPTASPGSYLKLLARFSHIFKNADFRDKLMAAKTADEMYQLIAEEKSE